MIVTLIVFAAYVPALLGLIYGTARIWEWATHRLPASDDR